MIPIGPERWSELRRVAVSPLIAAVLWTAAANFAAAAVRAEQGKIEPSTRQKLRLAQAALGFFGLTAWLRAGFRGARRFGLTMEETSIAGGIAGALAVLFALAVRVVSLLTGPVRPGARERAVALAALTPVFAFGGYVGGAALAAIGAFLGRSSRQD